MTCLRLFNAITILAAVILGNRFSYAQVADEKLIDQIADKINFSASVEAGFSNWSHKATRLKDYTFLKEPVNPRINFSSTPLFGLNLKLKYINAELFSGVRFNGKSGAESKFRQKDGDAIQSVIPEILNIHAGLQYFFTTYAGLGFKYDYLQINALTGGGNGVYGTGITYYEYHSNRSALIAFIPLRYRMSRLNLETELGLSIYSMSSGGSYKVWFSQFQDSPLIPIYPSGDPLLIYKQRANSGYWDVAGCYLFWKLAVKVSYKYDFVRVSGYDRKKLSSFHLGIGIPI